VIAEKGERVSFQCDSQGTTNWSFVDPATNTLSNLPSNTRVESNTLHIIYVEKSNEGIYECQGQLKEYNRGTQDKVHFFARSNLIMGRSILPYYMVHFLFINHHFDIM